MSAAVAHPSGHLTLTGQQKAAVVLAQVDPNRATKVLRALSESDVMEIMAALATLPPLTSDSVRAVLAEFTEQAVALMHVTQGGVEVARGLLKERFGAARADELITQFTAAQQTHPLSFLHRIDPHQMAGFLADEHPQTIAVVLTHLPADHAAQVLMRLDPNLRADVSRRIATMERIAPEVIQHLADVLEGKLAIVLRSGIVGSSEVGGLPGIVAILNQTDRSSEKQILADLESTDPELAEEIRNEMFVFDDVANLDDRSLQLVLRNVQPKDLAVALKGVAEDVREKFRRNMSERAAQDLAEDIELLGPTRVSVVEEAQQGIVRVVRELEAAGEIVLSRAADEYI